MDHPESHSGPNPDQIRQAEQVVARLKGEFGALLRALPVGVRTIAEVSEWLGVSVPVVQRLTRTIRHRGEPLEALTYLPGVRGLEQVLVAAAARDVSPERIRPAEAAWRRYAELVDSVGGSQARLLARFEGIHAEQGAQSGGSADAVFRSLARTTGRSFDAQIGVFIYAPSQSSGSMEAVSALSMLGIRRRPGALPVCPMQIFNPRGPADSTETTSETVDWRERPKGAVGQTIGDRLPVELVEEFSTSPLPELVLRREHGRLLILVDPEQRSDRPIDVTLASQHPAERHPRDLDPPVQHSTIVARGPSRSLTLQVHLHRQLARQCVTSAGAYLAFGKNLVGARVADPDGAIRVETIESRWIDRLPEQPPLEALGAGLNDVPRGVGRNLARRLFEAHDWNPEEFVAFRCHVANPVWGVQYLVSSDFSQD